MKITKYIFLNVLFVSLLVLFGCSTGTQQSIGEQDNKSLQTQEVTQEDDINTIGEMEKNEVKNKLTTICSNYCKSLESPKSTVHISQKECSGYCDVVTKYCRENSDAQHTDAKTCINMNMLGKIIEAHPEIANQINGN